MMWPFDTKFFARISDRCLHRVPKDTTIITWLMCAFCIATSIYIAYIEIDKYKIINNQYKNQAQESLNIIDNTLNLTFEYTNYINVNIGHQIVLHGNYSDYEFIFKILSNPKHSQYSKLLYFSWSLFDWVDNANFQRVNSQLGIRKPAPNVSVREYTTLSPKNPWTLQFAKPTIGNPSKKFVIPAATGITNYNGEYIGTVVVGFGVEDLIKQINQFANNKNLGFLLEGLDGTIYLKHGNDIEYLFERKLEHYPFKLKVGFKNGSIRDVFLKRLFSDLLNISLGAIIVGLLMFIIQRTLKRKTIQSDEIAESLRCNYLFSNAQMSLMQQQLVDFANEINDASIAKEKEQEIGDDEKRKTYSIIASLNEAKRRLFSPSYLHLTSVKLQNIIDSILKLYAYDILLAKLKIHTEFNFEESVRLDEIKIRKVVEYIILYILDSVHGKSILHVRCTHDKDFISLSFTCDKNIILFESQFEYRFIQEVMNAHNGSVVSAGRKIVLQISTAL